MKKAIAFLLVLLVSSAVFADIIIQQDYEGVGLYSRRLGGNCNPQITIRSDSEFVTYNGLSLSTMYEFNSRKENAIHYYAGYDVGFGGQGITSLAVGGIATEIASFGPCILDLNADLKLGASLGITDVFFPTAQVDVMVNIMKADRKGLYAGVGLSDQFIDLTFPSLFKTDNYVMNYIGLVFAGGIRF